jgi:hypothetical protein
VVAVTPCTEKGTDVALNRLISPAVAIHCAEL